MRDKKGYWMRKIPFFIMLGAAAVALFSWIVMLLWNAILPVVLGVPVISFWQAAGILVLSKILFSGFKGGGGYRGRHMRSHWKQKWEGMSEEERARFRDRCGRFFPGKMEKEKPEGE